MYYEKCIEIVENVRKNFLLKKITVTLYYIYLFVIIYYNWKIDHEHSTFVMLLKKIEKINIVPIQDAY